MPHGQHGIERRRSKKTTTATGAVAVLEPEVIPQIVFDELRQSHIEIRRRPDRSLVAVLELLSPTNKVGAGFVEYELKRSSILKQDVHLFELDLLHVGDSPALAQPPSPSDYRALLTRAERRAVCNVYNLSMRQRLPILPVPLRAPDADIHVDLQEVFDLTYHRGRYARSVSYDEPPALALSDDDFAWIAERTHAKADG